MCCMDAVRLPARLGGAAPPSPPKMNCFMIFVFCFFFVLAIEMLARAPALTLKFSVWRGVW